MSDSRVLRGLFSADLDEAEGGATPLGSSSTSVWKTLSGLGRLQKARREPSAEEAAEAEGQELLAIRLKQVQELAARTESYLQKEGAAAVAQPTTDTRSTSGATPENTGSDPQSTELSPSQLLSELIAAREQLKQAVEAHASERAAWETTGAELKGRMNASVSDARMRAELQAELNGARAQLRQAIDSHNTELRACLDELKTAADERTALEAAMQTAQTNSRQTADTYAAECAAWETSRDELKAALKHSSAELRQTINSHTSERASWADTLQQLNAAVDSARADLTNAAAAHHAELDGRSKELREVTDARAALQGALKAAERERQTAIDAHEAERKSWNSARQESELKVGQIQTALDAATTKLNETTSAYASAQAVWATTRLELEMRATQYQAAADAQAKTDETLQATALKLRQTTDAYASDRQAWDVVRRELEADVNRVCAELATAADGHHDELRTHKLELQKATEARTKLESELARAQAERQEAIDARTTLEAAVAKADAERQKAIDLQASDRAMWDATRHELEEDVNTARAAFVAFSERASGLLGQLPGFSQKPANSPAPVDLNDATGPLGEEPVSRGRLVGLRSAPTRVRSSDRESA